MTKEQEVIEYFKILKKHLRKDKQEMLDKGIYKFYETFEINLETVLNMLKEKDKEIEKLKKEIDLMAEEIAFNYEINSAVDIDTYKKQLKQYFKSKAEKE